MRFDCQLVLSVVILINMASGDLGTVPEVKDMAVSNTQFTLDLLKECGAEKKNENVFLGPFSITTTLAMTYLGASGDTANQMKTVLKWSSPEDATKGFGKYLPLLQGAASEGNPGYILVGAQHIFVDASLSLKSSFSSATQEYFTSDAKAANFTGNPEGERGNINDWVSDQTRDKISDLLPGGSIDSLTRLVLVQAMYFKGNWLHKFDAKNTRPAEFYSPLAQGQITVDMMRQTSKFNYGISKELQCSAVELPYASNSGSGSDHDLSMLILLPNAQDGLDKLVESLILSSGALEKIRSSLRPVKVDLHLPKFKVESSFALKEILIKLGMPLAFSKQADFSGMATGPQADELYISHVFHKAVVEVNEEGTEAAAATAAVMMARSMPIIRPFVADHPFLFFIIDKRANVALFSGQIANPPAVVAQQTKQEL